MTNMVTKKNFPLLFLIAISLLWTLYYSSNNWINGFGTQKHEWLLLIDGLLVIPLVCFYCLKDDLKAAILKSIVYVSLIILLGSFIIPQAQKHVWLYLESLRYVVLFAFVLLEVVTIFTVIIAIKSSLNQDKDPDLAIKEPIVKRLGQSFVTSLLEFEARVWTYALFAKKIKAENFIGTQHFSYHLKDGTQSNLLGFIIIICAEIPLVHTLLYFIWSPYVANVISILTAMSLIYFVAEYRAIAIRPVSITNKGLVIRYSVWNPLQLSFSQIESIMLNKKSISRNKACKRYNLFGVPNIEIQLKKSNSYKYEKIYLGLDNPASFIQSCHEFILKQK